MKELHQVGSHITRPIVITITNKTDVLIEDVKLINPDHKKQSDLEYQIEGIWNNEFNCIKEPVLIDFTMLHSNSDKLEDFQLTFITQTDETTVKNTQTVRRDPMQATDNVLAFRIQYPLTSKDNVLFKIKPKEKISFRCYPQFKLSTNSDLSSSIDDKN